jgi:polyferredoxin
MKRRQKIRKGFILFSFLLFPVTIYYFSPVLVIVGAAKGIVVGSAILFGLLFISGLMLGRGFCGWLCPGAGIQEICIPLQKKKVRKGDWIKYVLWVPWIIAVVFLAINGGGFRKVDPFFHIFHGISMASPYDYIVFYFFILLIVIPGLIVGKRSFCHHICWMAPFMVITRKMRNLFNWPSLHLKADIDKCVQCKTCEERCPMSLPVEEMVQRNSMENSECILCGSCVDVCPENVIGYRFSVHGWGRT